MNKRQKQNNNQYQTKGPLHNIMCRGPFYNHQFAVLLILDKANLITV